MIELLAARITGRAAAAPFSTLASLRHVLAVGLALLLAVAQLGGGAAFHAAKAGTYEAGTVGDLSAAVGRTIVLCHDQDGATGPASPADDRPSCADCCVLCCLLGHAAVAVPPFTFAANINSEFVRRPVLFDDAGGFRPPRYSTAQPRAPPIC